MKRGLHQMTWKEIEAAFQRNPAVLIPLGSMEQHGPHSPTGDFIVCEWVAQRTAEAAEAYYLPVIPFGYSEYFRCYPGTVSLSQRTVYALLRDVADSLLEHGVEKLVFLNGHGGNAPLIEGVARDILREQKIAVGSLDIWKLISNETKERLYGEERTLLGHGGDPVTSVMMFLQAENMRPDLLEEAQVSQKWEAFAIDRGLNSVLRSGCRGTVYFDMDAVTKDGMQGSPAVSSAEKGRVLLEEMTANCIEFVKRLQESSTRRRET